MRKLVWDEKQTALTGWLQTKIKQYSERHQTDDGPQRPKA
jgi:hypothetical protein